MPHAAREMASGGRRPQASLAAVCLAWILLMPVAAALGQTTPGGGVPPIQFETVPPATSGIHWKHSNAQSDERHLPETVGAGCGFLDFDGDGWMDIYLANSGKSDFFTPEAEIGPALYRNNGDGTFADVTALAGVSGGGFGMGVAAADFDRDGDTDLYVTAYGDNQLFRNRGDGTFEEVAARVGVSAEGWFTDAVWFDYDNDSHLDLFVSGFVSYSAEDSKYCGDNQAGRRHYCVPRSFRPTRCLLFRNRGDGTFRDASDESGIASVGSKAFGAVATDINRDGWQDLFVANDTVQNFLFVNQGDGTFLEEGLLLGVAYSDAGAVRSGMGVDATDYDGDGWQDLFVANIDQEMFSLYRNQQGSDFVDASLEIRRETLQFSGWGLRFSDFDHDGDPDLVIANGHPDDMIEMFKPLVGYKQRLLLFENTGADFRNVSGTAGKAFQGRYSGRGLAAGDYDNDGDVDLLVSDNGGRPLLLQNTTHRGNHWVGVRLVATASNAEAIGATISWQAGGTRGSRYRTSGGSYLSSHDPREVLGLGSAALADWIEVRWPSGTVTRLEGVSSGAYVTIREDSAHGLE